MNAELTQGAFSLSDSVSVLNGIGKTRAESLEKLGIVTLRDLLWHFPTSYEDRGTILPLALGEDGQKHAFLLTVKTSPRSHTLRGRMTLTKFRAFDESGTVEIVFFNQRYYEQEFSIGGEYRFFGKLTRSGKVLQLSAPAFERVDVGVPLPDYMPRYRTGGKLSQKILSNAIESALSSLSELRDPLPEEVRLKYGYPTLATAIRALHNPPTQTVLESALSRLVFDELFFFSLGISLSKGKRKRNDAPVCRKQNITPLLEALPYTLTEGQKTAIREIAADLRGDGESASPMCRILTGDVGCGKTVCAAAAIYMTVKSGYQAALMAPTEILARQHERSLRAMLEPFGIKVALLVGATSQKEKKAIYAALSSEGEERIDLLIGTHALLNDKVVFADLGLTVTDEQHRFGVSQRSALSGKNGAAHLLVMSATPIPRTLALTLYGDLDISGIRELPKGREPIETLLIGEDKRERLNTFIEKQVKEGGQVYVVCPAIEEEEEEEEENASFLPFSLLALGEDGSRGTRMKHAVSHAEALQKRFPELSVSCLHGRMKPAEKERVMREFSEGETQILVSTTVIEVGVDVPNAGLMIIENADRFGLSQLHQLRGRVGRGSRKSYCVLISDAKGEAALERLSALTRLHDGYEIAERDLALRGPGDFFASGFDSQMRQSGNTPLPLSGLCRDTELLKHAHEEALAVSQRDPTLTSPESSLMRAEVERLFEINENTFS